MACIDAEQANQLKLRKDQEYLSYIFMSKGEKEKIFSENLTDIEVELNNLREKEFIQKRAPDSESLIDLFYGYPVYKDERDMLSPLFLVETEASFTPTQKLRLLPKLKNISVNRAHFLGRYDLDEIQEICDELEGEFGSFEARLKAAQQYLGTTTQLAPQPHEASILFRSAKSGAKKKMRYELAELLKKKTSLTEVTALKPFVLGLPPKNDAQKEQKNTPILEVRLLNKQQEGAVAKGLQQEITVVTGPPGTGKTQVVTALIASAVYAGQTVLFSSNNNMPVDGVYQRLNPNGEKDRNWALRLGNRDKNKECQSTIGSLLNKLKQTSFDRKKLSQQTASFVQVDARIQKMRNDLAQAHSIQEKISEISCKENATVSNLPQNWSGYFDKREPTTLDEKAFKKYIRHSAPGLSLWLRRRVYGLRHFRETSNALLQSLFSDTPDFPGILELTLIDENWDDAIAKSRETSKYLSLHHAWSSFISQRRLLEKRILQTPSTLELHKAKEEKVEASQKLADLTWLSNIHSSAKEAENAINTFFKDIDDESKGRYKRLRKSLDAVKRFFPIWITTNQSINNTVPLQPAIFDLVIIDEAGQCDIPSVLPLLYRAKRAVFIGDPQQFHHITSLKDSIEYTLSEASNVQDLIEDWSYVRRSAFDRASASTAHGTLLSQHYRCHPDIIEFSNITFYDGKLVTQTRAEPDNKSLPIDETGLVWHHTPGNVIKEKTGAWNPSEVKRTVELFNKWEKQGIFEDTNLTFGIITPFRKQVNQLQSAFEKLPWFAHVRKRFTIGTAHSFQGSECHVLIYSPVVAENMASHLIKFASAQNDLINVTITRAQSVLCIIGDIYACQKLPANSPLNSLAAFAENLRTQKRYPLNAPEQALANILDELKFSYKTQYEIGEYRLDFIVNTSSGDRCNIEVDGDIHLTSEAVQHDAQRDAYIRSQGFRVIRLAARDISNKPNQVRELLARI